MKLNGNLNILLEGLHQFIGLIGNQKPCHILDTDGIGTHFHKDLGILDKLLKTVEGADGIGECSLGMAAFLLTGLYGSFNISCIIQGVKDTDDIHTIGDGLLYKVIHHIIGIMLVSQKVLSSQKHLELCLLGLVLNLSESLPGILI